MIWWTSHSKPAWYRCIQVVLAWASYAYSRRKNWNTKCDPSLPMDRQSMTLCITTKSSLYLTNSLTTVVSDPDLYRLLTFHVPNLTSLFHCLGRTERSVWFRGIVWSLITWLVSYGEELLAPHPTPKLEDYTLSAVRNCLFNIFAATLHNWRPFLHLQDRLRGGR